MSVDSIVFDRSSTNLFLGGGISGDVQFPEGGGYVYGPGPVICGYTLNGVCSFVRAPSNYGTTYSLYADGAGKLYSGHYAQWWYWDSTTAFASRIGPVIAKYSISGTNAPTLDRVVYSPAFDAAGTTAISYRAIGCYGDDFYIAGSATMGDPAVGTYWLDFGLGQERVGRFSTVNGWLNRYKR